MERGTAIWLGAGATALVGVVAAGLMMQDDSSPAAPAPPPPSVASPMPEPVPPPSDVRVPDESPSPVAEDAWVETASGLKYVDLEQGEGALVTEDATVIIDYTGWLAASGEMFDSSKRRARPLVISMSAPPVRGWPEALTGMAVGGKRQAVFPPELAYGQTGLAPRVPRDATVIFEFQVLRVDAMREAPTSPPEVAESDWRDAEDGLRIADVAVGDGRTLRSGDAVAIDYTGWLSTGRKFDSSLDRPRPSMFAWGSGEMLPGVEKGMTDMRIGGTRLIAVPPGLGYGDRGLRGFVPPNESLVFMVELVDAAPQ